MTKGTLRTHEKRNININQMDAHGSFHAPSHFSPFFPPWCERRERYSAQTRNVTNFVARRHQLNDDREQQHTTQSAVNKNEHKRHAQKMSTSEQQSSMTNLL